ncbi:MAG: phosphatidylserine decarboxylase family protein [Planctomycetia bacterium]|nr:phosphatidylserine decarboxylase family protein [Planctomycetia bacterium]
MPQTETSASPSVVEPLPANITSAQPGGGACYRLELAWGRLRRWYLRTFRPGYVRRMAAKRTGDARGCPHEVLDPRDLKYHRNRCTAAWDTGDDPFAWRDRLPLARWGLAEVQILGWPLLAVTVAVAFTAWWPVAIATGGVLLWVVSFFRDPPRRVPREAGLLVAPADGRVVEITRLDHEPFLGGPAVRIGIFLSIFNVHINRVPCRAGVLCLRYSPGKFLNALRRESATENENMWIGLEGESAGRRLIVRQIAGQFARRIVCDLRPGETLERGVKFGMIKLGSRTELIVPEEPSLEILVQVGERVKAGTSVLARYPADSPATTSGNES